MGMMCLVVFSIWRGQGELLPFFWSANGITSMFASVLGMTLSIEFGIACTFALGACCYALCAIMIIASRELGRVPSATSVLGLGLAPKNEVAAESALSSPSA